MSYADDIVLLTSSHHPSTPLKRLGDAYEWESPYSWPVRREFSRILHRPRPHLGIVYTERFLNSRPLTYFDDETKIIRARAGAILKAVHTPLPKPSRILRPYETLDSYRSHQLIPYGVPQHIYNQSYYSDPAHLTIGRGHLACIQYAGGKGYPRRKNLYSDENRNIRDEIKFRSYYNRPKPEDANTLATGFAWRLLHLPPKEEKSFKLYKHSRTLPLMRTKEDKENTSLDEDKEIVSTKRIHKTYTQPLDELPKTERSKVYSSPKETYSLNNGLITKSKSVTDEEPRKDKEVIIEKSEPVVEEQAPTPVEPPTVVEEDKSVSGIKKKKSKKEEDSSEKPYKRSLSHSKSVSDDKPEEKVYTETKPVEEPASIETVPETTQEPAVEESKLETPQLEEESPITNEPEPVQQVEDTPVVEEMQVEEEKESEIIENDVPVASEPEPEEIKTVELEPQLAPESEQKPMESDEIESNVEKLDANESLVNDSEPIIEEINQPEEPEVQQNESKEATDEIPNEVVSETEVMEEPVKTMSEDATDENKQEDVDGVVICNGTDSYTETRFREDDDGELVITEVREETSDTTVEASTGQITHTVYTTTTETVIEAVDTTTQISEVPEDSDKPEEHINETDITTDEENVEIHSE